MFISFDLSGVSFCIRPLTRSDLNDNNYYSLLSQLSDMDITCVTEKKSTEFFNSLDDNHQVFLLEEVATKRVIGTGTILIERKIIHKYGLVGHIEDIVLDEGYRHFGLGKIIVEHLTDICMFNKQCYKCILNCNEYNEYFYMQCGYKCNGLQMSLYKKC